MPITQLGYVGINTAKIAEWKDVATTVLGAEVISQGAADPTYLRFCERHHRLALYPAKTESVAFYGYEVAGGRDLEELAGRLSRKGIKVTEGSKAECADRAVDVLVKFVDPEGLNVELFINPLILATDVCPTRGISGFVMGRQGLGHVNIACRNYPEMVRFYTEELGFLISDYIRWDGADATFFHCNPRHHSLGFMNEVFGMVGGQLHHIMIQVRDLNDVGRAYDIVKEKGIPLELSLGRHTNDQMTSFYFRTPSGFAIEYGWGGIEIDDSVWQVKSFDSPRVWGHQYMGA